MFGVSEQQLARLESQMEYKDAGLAEEIQALRYKLHALEKHLGLKVVEHPPQNYYTYTVVKNHE